MTSEKILIVEDEPIVALHLKENLERLGYSVPCVVESGSSVVASVARHKPDLLIVDVHLRGGADGIEAAYKAKAEFGLPVIFLTAYSDADTLRRAALASADAFLLKPCDERELDANVKIALARSKGDRAMRRELLGAVSIIDALEEPVLIVDSAEVIVGANRAAAAYLQSSEPSRLSGVQLSRLLSPEPGDLLSFGLGRRVGGARTPISVAKREKLSLPDGRSYGEFVVLGGVERHQRRILEASAVEANAYLKQLLPGLEAAGHGYAVSGFLCSCLAGSGNLYDVFPVGPRTSAFYGLDASGSGILASLTAFTLHDLIPVISWGSRGIATSPSEVVSALEARYARKDARDGESSFSIAYGNLDTSSGAFRLVCVGSVSAMYVGSRGSFRPLCSDATRSGAAPSAMGAEKCGVLEKGDRLMIASEGLMSVFGAERGHAARSFEAFLRDFSGRPVQPLVDAIRRLAEKDGPRSEDASFLVIERKA